MSARIALTGVRFGRLVAIEMVGSVKGRGCQWRCICDCGREVLRYAGQLRAEGKSCGCIRRAENRTERHGNATHQGRRLHPGEYGVWKSMHNRCRLPTVRLYERYGGRGIAVCERWNDFALFLADMGPRPLGTTLDRINNDGNYEPGNCRWATQEQQRFNRSDNRLIECFGRVQPLGKWAREFSINDGTLANRLRLGWPIERALTAPVQRQRGRNAHPDLPMVNRRCNELEQSR